MAEATAWIEPASRVACWALSDEELYRLFIDYYFMFQPNAKAHLVHYRIGQGTVYREDVNGLFVANPRIRTRIARLIHAQITATAGSTLLSGVLIGRGVDDGQDPPIRQQDYDSEDWRNANGNIDEVRWSLIGTYNPRGYNMFNITIRDPYEWHDQEGRATQCLHAAFVRLKRQGAADYMTEGTARIQLPPIWQSPDLPLERIL
ncbi:MAG: hypothetical protein R2822_27340 [Spirosomataceae bacterium]